MKIFRDVSPHVEPISLDEAFIDVTGAKRLLGSGREIAMMIRAKVEKEQGITCSVGIAHNKFIAKLASQHCKPNGLLEIATDQILSFLHPLPANAIWGVGPKTNEQLEKLGLRTVGEIANTPLNTLIRALGEATGSSLYELAWGRDYREVISYEAEKSISAAETFASDIDDPEEILREFLRLCEKATLRMRDAGYCAKTISIKVRFADFKTITRSKKMDQPISGTKESFEVAKQLYLALKLDRVRIRLVGVSLEGLTPADEAAEQLLIGQRDVGWREADSAIDRVKAKFGRGSVRPARLVSPSDED
jgi:DNA polymerase-4